MTRDVLCETKIVNKWNSCLLVGGSEKKKEGVFYDNSESGDNRSDTKKMITKLSPLG